MHVRVRVGQWGSQNPQSAHMAASVASRYALGADGVGAARPRAPVAAGSLCLALRARRRRRGGAARPRAPTCALRVTAHVVSWGGECGDVEDVVRCALLERLGARRASSSCRGRGWGGTPREPQCRRRRQARAERRYGGSWQEGGARAASPPLQGLTPPARRPARRGRRVRVPRAFKRPAKTLWWVGGGVAATPNYLRLASPDRGKYYCSTVLLGK